MLYNDRLYGTTNRRVFPSLSNGGSNIDKLRGKVLALIGFIGTGVSDKLRIKGSKIYIDVDTGDWIFSDVTFESAVRCAKIVNIDINNFKILSDFIINGEYFNLKPKVLTIFEFFNIAYPFCSFRFGSICVVRWLKITSSEMYDTKVESIHSTNQIYTPQELGQILKLSKIHIPVGEEVNRIEDSLIFNALSVKGDGDDGYIWFNAYRDLFKGKLDVNNDIDRRVKFINNKAIQLRLAQSYESNRTNITEIKNKCYSVRKPDMQYQINNKEYNVFGNNTKNPNCILIGVIQANVKGSNTKIVGYRFKFTGDELVIGDNRITNGSSFIISTDFLNHNYMYLKGVLSIYNASLVENAGCRYIRTKPGFTVESESLLV